MSTRMHGVNCNDHFKFVFSIPKFGGIFRVRRCRTLDKINFVPQFD
jgi:hypothetical protein